MAPRTASRTLGVPDYRCCLEIIPLKLSAEHFPMPCSLRELVLDRYGEASMPPGSSAHSLSEAELLEYLKNTTDFELDPLAVILGQIEAMGDPAEPSRDQAAILQWLGKALELWEKEYPLENSLPRQLRSLKPLCAALALKDPRFLQPGAHPMHQLLDIIHARAVGWQPSLDRLGAVLEQQIAVAVEHARTWFDNNNLELAIVRDEFSAAIERDQARAARMTQRVIDTELGKVKNQAAKREAVLMLNTAMEKYAVPLEIEDFIKGPWYSSAQLLLLKFGAESEQWLKMSETTDALLDSLQGLEEATEERRQHIFQVVTRLPKEMRRWMLSLHHDTEAVNEAMGLVEYTHLRILRRQSVVLEHLSPLAVPSGEDAGNDAIMPALADYEKGQWFRIDQDKALPIRAQIALKIDDAQQLLFINLAGIKVLHINFSEFAELIASGKVTPIPSGHSFSRSLAKAAGIENTELLDAVVEVLGEAPPEDAPAPAPAPARETSPLAQAADDDQRAETDLPGQAISAPVLNDNPLNLPLVEELDREDLHATRLTPADAMVAPPSVKKTRESIPAATTREHLESPPEEDGFAASPDSTTPATAHEGFLVHQAQALDHATEVPAIQTAAAAELPQVAREPLPVAQQSEDISADNQERVKSEAEPRDRQITLPTDTWLGFHDCEVPMLARLAVHDRIDNRFIFVNRKGIKMRELSKAQLLKLIDDDLVDILQRSADFRDRLVDMRKNLDE